MHPEDTIVALATAPGPGARAVIRLSGPKAFDVLFAVCGQQFTRRGIHPAELRLPGVHSGLPADVLAMPGPGSYTGQDSAEIHTISSPPLIDLLLGSLQDGGARAARPGEFTMRAFLAGKKDLTQAEAVLAVIHAGNTEELDSALAQLAGGVKLPLQALREDLLNLLADVEAGLDFTDEHIEFVDQKQILLRVGAGMAHLTNLRKQLDARALSDRAFRVALVGEPNAGKSSLFNSLAGEATAIVSPVAGTTRDYLTRVIRVDGVTIELIDTAGWQESVTVIEEQAQSLGHEQTRQADLVVWCVEAVRWVTSPEHARVPPALKALHPPLLVLTKADLIDESFDHPATSVITKMGLDDLKSRLARSAREARPPSLASSLSRCRHHVEKAIGHLRAAHHIVLFEEPAELLALELRLALEQIGEMVGAVYTDDLLDRIFSRFCIGK